MKTFFLILALTLSSCYSFGIFPENSLFEINKPRPIEFVKDATDVVKNHSIIKLNPENIFGGNLPIPPLGDNKQLPVTENLRPTTTEKPAVQPSLRPTTTEKPRVQTTPEPEGFTFDQSFKKKQI